MQVYRHTNILLSGLYHMTKQVLLFDRLINFYNEFYPFSLFYSTLSSLSHLSELWFDSHVFFCVCHWVYLECLVQQLVGGK